MAVRLGSALPDAVRAAAKGYVSLDEAERSALIQDLAAGGDEVAAGLVEWWRQVSAEELETLDLELSRSRYVRVEVPSGDDPPAALNRMVNDGSLFAYFVISPDPVASDEGCKYISLNRTDQDLRRWFADQAFQVVRARRIEQAGLDAETSDWFANPHCILRSARSIGAATRPRFLQLTRVQQWAVIPFVYLLWMAIFINAQTLMTNTVEEKSSRLIEVLLSALSPFELMAGKIAGTAAVGPDLGLYLGRVRRGGSGDRAGRVGGRCGLHRRHCQHAALLVVLRLLLLSWLPAVRLPVGGGRFAVQ